MPKCWGNSGQVSCHKNDPWRVESGEDWQKKTAEALKVTERAKLFTSLKGSKYILLKGAVKLSNKQKEKLNQVKEASPLVGIMHSLKEEFHYLFEKSKNLGKGY